MVGFPIYGMEKRQSGLFRLFWNFKRVNLVGIYKNFIKTLVDFTIALLGTLLLSPMFVIVAISLFIANRGSILFLQRRPGENGKMFTIVKFKTMNDDKDAFGNILPDSQRLTKAGSIVRKTSLDEIPQLINVLKGEMSLVGPRPLLPKYLPLYNDFQKRRHECKPGITGWAQVNGRNSISWDEKFKLDVWYVDNVSFLLDVKIIFLTIKKVLVRDGISAQGHATTDAFNG
jgi:lipopolysaccharide/colanic/teichoic acid biosynthesis glycosyltransferase